MKNETTCQREIKMMSKEVVHEEMGRIKQKLEVKKNNTKNC
jgi:hypothetical protein